MGIEYELFNHRNKTIFELGKGSWDCFYDKANREYLFDEKLCGEYLFSLYRERIENSINRYSEEEQQQSKEYYTRFLPPKLFNFVDESCYDDIECFSDCYEPDWAAELKYEQYYKYVGSRYYKDYDLDGNFINSDINYHLTDEWRNRHKTWLDKKYKDIDNRIIPVAVETGTPSIDLSAVKSRDFKVKYKRNP